MEKLKDRNFVPPIYHMDRMTVLAWAFTSTLALGILFIFFLQGGSDLFLAVIGGTALYLSTASIVKAWRVDREVRKLRRELDG